MLPKTIKVNNTTYITIDYDTKKIVINVIAPESKNILYTKYTNIYDFKNYLIIKIEKEFKIFLVKHGANKDIDLFNILKNKTIEELLTSRIYLGKYEIKDEYSNKYQLRDIYAEFGYNFFKFYVE